MYALVNRIRLFASGSVLEAAEAFVKKLVEKYGEQNMSIDQIKSVALEQHADPLNDFALKCRAELREVYERATGNTDKSRSSSFTNSLQKVHQSIAINRFTEEADCSFSR